MLIDSDVIIRFLTADDPTKALAFEKFLSSNKKGRLTDTIFAEIYWTLRSFYKFSKPKVLDCLEIFVNSPSISCNQKVLQQTLRLLKEKPISFIDAYTASVAYLENDSTILSYDRDFDKIKFIKRVEPGSLI